nr:hypothetical protein CFP56_24720 [Quercus suber]
MGPSPLPPKPPFPILRWSRARRLVKGGLSLKTKALPEAKGKEDALLVKDADPKAKDAAAKARKLTPRPRELTPKLRKLPKMTRLAPRHSSRILVFLFFFWLW